MGSLLTYDVKFKHDTVKAKMKDMGYVESLSKTDDLPNTTLYHASKTQAEAIRDLKSVCSLNAAGLENAIAVAFDSSRVSTWEVA